VVVENRPGAGGNIAGEAVARAEPDGQPLLFTSIGTGAINYAVYGPRMPWKPEDMAAVGLVTRMPNVLMVANRMPIRTMPEFLAFARGRQGEITYGTAGIGSSPHVCMELLSQMTGIRLVHVPFRGGTPALIELRAGRIARYQIVAPTSWNFSPRDAAGTPGALEAALEGTPVSAGDPTPVAVQHVVRSFDPCMVCTVH
jgi:tripartite-type tricarboxylate transporter receptor subunit TctC